MKNRIMSKMMIVALSTTMITVVPGFAAADCDNYGVQVTVGDYNCQVQYCDGVSGSGAAAGAGGPGAEAGAGASAGNSCSQSQDPSPSDPNCLTQRGGRNVLIVDCLLA